MLDKTLESPFDCKEIQPVHSEGDQSWVFIGRTDVEAETPIFWPPDAKSWLLWKDSDVGKDLRQEETGTTEDEMVGWHHWLNGHGFGWTPGDGDGQGGLKCCGSRGCKESDTTERLNWTDWSLVSSYILDHFFLVSITLLLSFHPLLELDISEFPCLIFSLGDFIHSIFSHWTYADDSQIYISHWFSRW